MKKNNYKKNNSKIFVEKPWYCVQTGGIKNGITPFSFTSSFSIFFCMGGIVAKIEIDELFHFG